MAGTPMTVAEVVAALAALEDRKPGRATAARSGLGDVRDGSVYVMDEPLVFAVQVAVATARPLLLTDAPGSGKSSLAPYLAARLGWRYYEHVVTARTQPADLLWQFDRLRKVADLTGREPAAERDYLEPGALWWAFDRAGAATRGPAAAVTGTRVRGGAREPFAEVNEDRSRHHAVVLVDELDQADPSVPNALLVPLGAGQFVVEETRATVRARGAAPAPDGATPSPGRRPAPPALVVVTTNGSRELPPAFVRRCVAHELTAPDAERLELIAAAHALAEGRSFRGSERQRARALAEQTVSARTALADRGRTGAGTAEFLDALRASRELSITPTDGPAWTRLIDLTVAKEAARR